MMTLKVCGAVVMSLCAVVAGTPSLDTDGTNIKLNAPGGDVMVVGGGATGCTANAPCALGATLSSMQSSIDTISNSLQTTYLTAAAASSTYATQSTLANYDTTSDSLAQAQALRDYVDTEITALANATGVGGQVADIISGARGLSILHLNGTFFGDITISSDAQLVSMAPLLDHVSVITGNLYIYSINAVPELGNGLFSNLTSVGGYVQIRSCSGLTSMGAAFPALTSVGGYVQVSYNYNLLSIDGSFPVLTSVGGALTMQSNTLLQSLGRAFPMLTSIGGGLVISGNTAITGTSVGNAFGALSSMAGASLNLPTGPRFNASTMIFLGDVYLSPGSTLNTGTLAEIATMIANVRVITGRVYIARQPTGTALPANFGSNLRIVSGQVALQYNYFTSINGAFTNLVSAGGVSVYYNYGLTTWGNAFSSLQMCFGSLQVNYNQNVGLTQLNGIFPQLTNVTGLYIQYNYNVRTMTGAFPRLAWNTAYTYITYNRALTTIEPTAFASLRYTLGLQIQRNYLGTAGLTTMDGAFPALQTVGRGSLYIYYEYRLTSMVGAFPQLTAIEGQLYCYYNTILRSMSGSFPRLTSITGNFYFYYNYALQTMNGAFPSLATVGTNFYMYRNYQLTGVSNIFGSMTTIGGQLNFYQNGCSSTTGTCNQPFCTAVQSTFCPATSNYNAIGYAFAARACCTAFCALATSTC